MNHFSLKQIKTICVKAIAATFMLFVPAFAFAADKPVESALNNPLALVLTIVAVSLMLAIAMLAYVVLGGAQVYMEKFRKKNTAGENVVTKAAYLLLLMLVSSTVFAADTPAEGQAAAVTTISGMSKFTFYTLVSVIAVEIIVIFGLLYNLQRLLAIEKEKIAAANPDAVQQKSFSWKAWWEKVNAFRPAHQEADIDLGHDYDGIRELDNRLPPWWLWGFYVTIVIAGIYFYRYHVSHSAPSSKEEFEMAMAKAEVEKQEYIKKVGNLVDENTVKMISDPAAIQSGKQIFTENCIACHGADGGGQLGPNLTDAYWLHGGNIKDIFKTIKYGAPNGMKSWKDDFSPAQIAQLASYIKTLAGTKPATPKEPQGQLYKEEGAAPGADSTSAKKLASL